MLSPTPLANAMKAAFSTSPDLAIKALTDAHYVTLATVITDQINLVVAAYDAHTHVETGGVTAPPVPQL